MKYKINGRLVFETLSGRVNESRGKESFRWNFISLSVVVMSKLK
jgi:hypothetical protein